MTARSETKSPAATLPEAVLRPERRLSLVWIVPVAALLLAAWLGLSAWRQRGLIVNVHLPEGHGLMVGAAVRYRGVAVGEVRGIEITDGLDGVVATVGLTVQADGLARSGTRFWVVRPRLNLTGIEGLETLVGPRYLAVAPATLPAPDSPRSERQREFVGLAEPPVVESIEPGDIEILLETDRRGSVHTGASVTYRQMPIGTVLSVGLSGDASVVEVRVHVAKAFRSLVREGTRFWDAGGIRIDGSLTGLSIEVDSLEEANSGGVALATPPIDEAGTEVRTGHRFRLHDAADDEWLEWETTVAVGSALLPPGAGLPHPLRAVIGWEQGFIFKGTRTRHGWVLQRPDGLLGPADLLAAPPGKSEEENAVRLEVAGRAVPLAEIAPDQLLAILPVQVSDHVWPDRRVRRPADPEDCIAVADPTAPPLPLTAARLAPVGDAWRVDPALPVDGTWHGAAVLSRADGRLIGMLLVEKNGARIARITAGP